MKRKEGITIEEFREYWSGKHASLGLEVIPKDIKLTRYIQNYAIQMSDGFEPLFDGVVEFCFKDKENFEKWLNWFFSEEGQLLREDEKNFIDSSSVQVVAVEENVIISDK